MAAPGIDSLTNPRKKDKIRTTAVNLANMPSFDFPDDVLTNIFSLLPIKQAVQASTVSPRFKESWLFNRKLCFGKDFAKRHAQKDFLDIVNRVFDRHQGPKIQTFSLFFDPTGAEDAVENWIQISVDKGVEELDLNFSLAKIPYKLTSDFADIKTIKTLKLCRIELDLSPTFKGLDSLETLVLTKIDIKSKSIASVFFYCLSLQTLELVKCRKIGYLRILAQNQRRFKALKIGDCLGLCGLEIDSPTIRSFYYSGRFISFKFNEISLLNDVILCFKPPKPNAKFFDKGALLCDLSHVRFLSASSTLLQDLYPPLHDPLDLQFYFGNLKELQLFMETKMYCNLYEIALFLKKCPCLEKLFIDLNGVSFEDREYWIRYQRPVIERDDEPLRHLQFIKFQGFRFEDHEIEMVQYLLERALALESLVLVAPKTAKQGAMNISNEKYFRELCERSPVSPFAEVCFYDRDTNQSPVPKHSKTWFQQ